MSTVKELLDTAGNDLRGSSQSPRLDAELLLSAVTGYDKTSLISKSQQVVSQEIEQKFYTLITRRKANEPVAYLTGHKEFFGYDFLVNSSVLIPRPETELLVEMAIPKCYGTKRTSLILDLGTGSGCVSISLAYELKKFSLPFQIVAVDCEDSALEVAKKNIEKHNFSDSITLVKSDWFSNLSKYANAFDVILSNPPYIAEGDPDVSPELKYEPQRALYSGSQGLDSINYLILNSANYLKRPGHLICEMGCKQREDVQQIYDKLIADSKLDCKLTFSQDFAGLDRIFEIQFN